jgi:hypothetical protein
MLDRPPVRRMMAGMRWTREPWGESGDRGNGAMIIVALAALAVIVAAILEAS